MEVTTFHHFLPFDEDDGDFDFTNLPIRFKELQSKMPK